MLLSEVSTLRTIAGERSFASRSLKARAIGRVN